MSGMEDLVIAGGTEMMSMEPRRESAGLRSWTRQPAPARPSPAAHQGICADAIATLEKASRAKRSTRSAYDQPAARRGRHRRGPLRQEPDPVYKEDGTLALDREEFPRPQTTAEGLARSSRRSTAMADIPADDDEGTTYRG
jgi:acetyl-CoA C-acetyltransferase